MKILHLMLACFYIDNYSYQENYLPKHHKLQGHDVEIIASLFTFDENGKGKWLSEGSKYINEHGIPVTRLEFADRLGAVRFRYYKGLLKELERIQPDVIFIHGVQFRDIGIVARYCKTHSSVKVYADNHSDFSNSASNWISKNILHRVIWRNCAKKIEPYVAKFYGVLPARVDFLVREYGIPKQKVELLVMGADDDLVQKASEPDVRQKVRSQYGISEDDFVVMTGGKIDRNKPQVLMLMEAINQLSDDKIKLLVFGNVHPDLQQQFDEQLSSKVRHIGWKKSEDIYCEFAAADLVAFPGLHSVLWEQAVAMGKPCVFRKLTGFTHIDLGGNCVFFQEDTAESYGEIILSAKKHILELKNAACEKGMQTFSYRQIAKRSLEE